MNKEKVELILKLVREDKITDKEAILLIEDGIVYCPTIIPNYDRGVGTKTLPYVIPKGPGDTPETWNNIVSSTSSVVYKDGRICSSDEVDIDTCSDFEKYLKGKNAKNN